MRSWYNVLSGFSDESRASFDGSPFVDQLRDAINPLVGTESRLAQQVNVLCIVMLHTFKFVY